MSTAGQERSAMSQVGRLAYPGTYRCFFEIALTHPVGIAVGVGVPFTWAELGSIMRLDSSTASKLSPVTRVS